MTVDDLTCEASIDSISIQIASIDEMLKLGYSCSESDVIQEVDIMCVVKRIVNLIGKQHVELRGELGLLGLSTSLALHIITI